MSGMMDAIKKRRSVYGLAPDIPVADAELEEALGNIIKNAPTAYNMQNTRLVLLLQAAHKKLWEIVLDALRPQVPPDKFGRTEDKIGRFAAAHGTLLYFNDAAVTKKYMDENPLYADSFPGWVQQQNAMLQYAVWCYLAEQGLGASLQHYNPLIDSAVQAAFGLPGSWQLIAQMPFGSPTFTPGEKGGLPVSELFFVREMPV